MHCHASLGHACAHVLNAGLLLAVLLGSPAHADDQLREAQHLLHAGQPEPAFRLLEPLVDARPADVELNYLLGIAALDSGRPGEALFAFERVLAVAPDHANARAELARAHIALGELDLAERELRAVLRSAPSASAQAAIERHLAHIEQERAQRARIGQVDYAGFVSLSAGYDSNFNTGARDDTIGIPLFGGFQVRLSRLFVEQHSAFVGPSLGGSVTKTLSRTTQVFAAASANGRYHFSENDFIPYTLSALAGIQYATGPDALRLSIDTRQHLVTNFHLQRFFGATAQYRRLLSRHDEFELFLRASVQEFPETRRLDSNLYLGGGSWTHVFGGDDGPRVTFSAFAGTNDERGNDPTVGREMFGVQLAVRYAVTERDTAFGTATAQRHVYGAPDPLFGRTRRDERLDLALGWQHAFAPQWSITPELRLQISRSTIDLHAFDRVQALVTIRRDFD